VSAAEALRPVGRVVRASHERWDGGGYPDGLAGEQIPLGARIVLACDAWDAMTSDRTYRRALSPEQAAAELRAHMGTQFDPDVVAALLTIVLDGAPSGTLR
jgi:HD-GYP domain-containing protein (c-di-GMP phosphodiesterase class II)